MVLMRPFGPCAHLVCGVGLWCGWYQIPEGPTGFSRQSCRSDRRGRCQRIRATGDSPVQKTTPTVTGQEAQRFVASARLRSTVDVSQAACVVDRTCTFFVARHLREDAFDDGPPADAGGPTAPNLPWVVDMRYGPGRPLVATTRTLGSKGSSCASQARPFIESDPTVCDRGAHRRPGDAAGAAARLL